MGVVSSCARFAALAVFLAVISAAAQPAYVIESKNFRIPELGLSINLPKEWTDLGKERIDTMNRLTKEKAPRDKSRYVAGLQRDLSFSRRNGYPTYLLIQKLPSKVTAKSLRSAFPKLRKQSAKPAAPGDAYLDETLKVIVVASGGTGEEGPFITRTYTIPMKTNLVNIYAYCRAASASNFIPELASALLSIKIDDALKPPDHWVEDLKWSLRDPEIKITPAPKTNALPAAPPVPPGTNTPASEVKRVPEPK